MIEMQQDEIQKLRYRFYEQQAKAGVKIRLDQIYICRFCGEPYKLIYATGASKSHCHNQDCRDAAARAARLRDKMMRRQLHRREVKKGEVQYA